MIHAVAQCFWESWPLDSKRSPHEHIPGGLRTASLHVILFSNIDVEKHTQSEDYNI